MADDSVTADWPGVCRDGEPELIRGPLPGSLKMQNKYKIRTTPVPAGAHGENWLGFFNSQLSKSPVAGIHNGNEISVECWPGVESRMVEAVDAAIEYANKQLRALHR